MNVLPKPFDHPAAWKGEELFSRSDWLCELTPSELAEIDKALLDGEELPSGALVLPTLGERLKEIQHNLEEGSGACMLRGLPIERYDEEQVRRIFWGLMAHLGTPVSQSAKGETIFSVRDEGYRMGQPQARGPNTSKRLSFHTDRCDVIAFLCLRQAKVGGGNQLVSSMTLFNELRRRVPEHLAVLMQPYYYRRHNIDTGNERPWCAQPIFSQCEEHFAGSYLRVFIDRAYELDELPDMTAAQAKALDALETLANDPALHVTFRQRPGDLLVLNNWVTFHRRDEFEDHDDPALRRHLLRIWLAVPNSRPLDPAFEANYGSTRAGAIRGGIWPSKAESEPSN